MSLKRLLTAIVLELLVLCMVRSAIGANLVVNGSFETNPCTSSTPGQQLGLVGNAVMGWFIPASDGIYPWCLQNNVNIYGAGPTPYGNQWLVLGEVHTGIQYSIQQTLTGLNPGSTYKLSFAIASENGCCSTVEVSFPSGSSTAAQTFTAPASGMWWTAWATKTMNFVATGSSVTLQFKNVNLGPGIDLGLDNVEVEAACAAPPNSLVTVPLPGGFSCGSTNVGTFLGTIQKDEQNNELQLFCSSGAEFDFKYAPAGGSSRQVGRCPWVGGQNDATITYVDNDKDGQADCFVKTFWRSAEPHFLIFPSIDQGQQGLIDWKTFDFDVQTGTLILRHFASVDGPGGLFPDKLIKKATNVDPLSFNPNPSSPGNPPMTTVVFAPCDLDRDGDCDADDHTLLTKTIGECEDGENYNELADADHDGCVTPIDEEILASSDSDNDGILGFNDACPRSDLRTTVVIDSCDSEVINTLQSTGCTISDLIARCAEGVNNHGQFVSCVAQLTNDLKADGTITGEQKGAIQSCAAQARIP